MSPSIPRRTQASKQSYGSVVSSAAALIEKQNPYWERTIEKNYRAARTFPVLVSMLKIQNASMSSCVIIATTPTPGAKKLY